MALARQGHEAHIYQHATEDHDGARARAISELITGRDEPTATVQPLLPKGGSAE